MKNPIRLGAFACISLASPQAWSAIDCIPLDPLIVDVRGDGIVLGAPGIGVYFDLFADGTPEHMQWVRPQGDDAFLVADLNGNGIVDDGSELFGQGMKLVLEGHGALNGFLAIQQYDLPALGGNDDGQISSADAIWSTLRLWTDSNADGKSSPSEMKTPRALRLMAFETIPKFSQHVDEAGNRVPYYSWVTRPKGYKVKMVDVYFAELP